MGKIKIRIYPDGIIQAETNGIKGKKCTDYKKIISNLTGAKIIEEQYTSEYYEEVKNNEVEEIRRINLSEN